MKEAMDRLYKNNVGRLPVVERDDPKKVVGIVTRTDAIAAYEVLSRDGS
jgi:CIC family chloride channel protein